MGAPNAFPDIEAWQKAEDAARTAEHDWLVLFRAFRRLGGFDLPLTLYTRARELRSHADALRRALCDM